MYVMSIVLVFGVLAVVLLVDWQLQKRKEGKGLFTAFEGVGGDARELRSLPKLLGMSPESRAAVRKEFSRRAAGRELLYHPGHAWAVPLEDDVVAVGADEISGKLMGRLEVLNLPEVGERVKQGQTAWTLTRGERELRQASPVSGVVKEVNAAVLEDPELVNRSPYKQGWLLKVEAENLVDNVKNLFSGALAQEWLALSRARINAVFAPVMSTVSATAQDGGELMEGLGERMTDEQWDAIHTELFEKK